ncbi:MAG: phytanoyl-CoA dioxygenase family protein [Acidobacteria bacterium]|nr:phytanoyl-CoA dioxygenase family protein [Acidobacteriota bacterium]
MQVDELHASFLRDGYCCVEGVIGPSEIEAIRDSVARDVRANSLLPPPQGYVPGFLRFNQAIAPYLAAPPVLALINKLFGPHARISMVTGSINGPGIPRGDLHADWPYNQKNASHIPAPYPDSVLHVLTMWMLTDFTEENGATIIIPGTHRMSDHPRKSGAADPKQPHPGEQRLLGKAGTVGVLDARMWHAIAPNVTGEERVAVIVRYAPWWLNLDPLRPGTADRADIVEANNGVESPVPALTRELFDTLPAEVRPLLSYGVAR